MHGGKGNGSGSGQSEKVGSDGQDASGPHTPQSCRHAHPHVVVPRCVPCGPNSLTLSLRSSLCGEPLASPRLTPSYPCRLIRSPGGLASRHSKRCGDEGRPRSFSAAVPCLAVRPGDCRCTRGKGIVISSGTRSALDLRSPPDVVNIGTLFNLKEKQAREALDANCLGLVERAANAKTFTKGFCLWEEANESVQDKYKVKRRKC